MVLMLRARGGQQTLHFRLTASSGSTVSVALVPEGSLQTIAEQSCSGRTPRMLGSLDSTRENAKKGGGGARKSTVSAAQGRMERKEDQTQKPKKEEVGV